MKIEVTNQGASLSQVSDDTTYYYSTAITVGGNEARSLDGEELASLIREAFNKAANQQAAQILAKVKG